MPLTNIEIKNLKPGEKPFKVSDGHGLHLLVQTNGSKLWRVAYRCLLYTSDAADE